MHALRPHFAALLLILAAPACVSETEGTGPGSGPEEVGSDGGVVSAPSDAAAAEDARVPAQGIDAAVVDGGASEPSRDADAAEADASIHVEDDASTIDAGAPDAGDASDAGALDAGDAMDGGSAADAGVAVDDAATADDGGSGSEDGGLDQPSRCPGREHVGDVVVRTEEDLAALRGIVCIRGDLDFVRGLTDRLGPWSGAIPDLRTVFGNVSFSSSDELELPLAENLTTIEGTLSLGTRRPVRLPSLVQTGGLSLPGPTARHSAVIELPALRRVEGNVQTFIPSHVETVRLPALEHVSGNMDFLAASELRELSVPELRTVEGRLRLQSLSVLDELAFPALQRVKQLSVEGTRDSVVGFVDLSALEEVAGRFDIVFLGVERIDVSRLRSAAVFGLWELPRLTSVDARSLVSVAQQFLISHAPLLTALDLSSLSRLFLATISDCPMLSECVVAAVNAQLAPESRPIRALGLRSDPSCAAP